MAAKTPIINFSLKCTECNNRNYYKTKNRNFKNKIELKKYCPKCRKHTLHVESKI
ncbi:MAG: 50S ribosomal protein L33 [Defluviitoga tunisiensis]|jgi:large subunit ribosomal protein L33|uniref:50S ribosomal protein L33 n=1 Tax=Defluviitoga tunisiensis TaxID=1006576 RepID=UPI000A05CFD7|nr:50S ribosomal protein L33 [Defluviitoga tunisiensis]HHV01608.1 50S ribosomal protein L33 [Defluviitoga tunisiensis]HOK16848.1 50S ribosomal protein L33 [Defluviitoga tunisiensis]HOL87058.1 50S ribosomal protein L33 [Defluviitoga tunisiensis]HPP10837.1 50S ribosomal protein L33 [Defluviitoga tunisiensis]HPU59858.1 50S ribosomal protein L33 [Defluviitoga tunisiensis]